MIFPKILIITSVIFVGGCITNADMASDSLLTHKGTLPTPDESGYWDRKEEHAHIFLLPEPNGKESLG